jgi:hypothetical protein
MTSDFKDGDEPSLRLEEVERRGDVRGILRDVSVTLPDSVVLPVAEGGRKGFFCETDDPDRFRLGEVLEVGVSGRGIELECRMEVVRKEIHPRRGLVLRVVYITPVGEEKLKQMLEQA